MKLFLLFAVIGTVLLASCGKECNCADLQLQPGTWMISDSVIHAAHSRNIDSGAGIFFWSDTSYSAPYLFFEFFRFPVQAGTYRIVKSPRKTGDVCINAGFSPFLFVPADSSSSLEVTKTTGEKFALKATGIKMKSINAILFNSSTFLSLNLAEF